MRSRSNLNPSSPCYITHPPLSSLVALLLYRLRSPLPVVRSLAPRISTRTLPPPLPTLASRQQEERRTSKLALLARLRQPPSALPREQKQRVSRGTLSGTCQTRTRYGLTDAHKEGGKEDEASRSTCCFASRDGLLRQPSRHSTPSPCIGERSLLTLAPAISFSAPSLPGWIGHERRLEGREGRTVETFYIPTSSLNHLLLELSSSRPSQRCLGSSSTPYLKDQLRRRRSRPAAAPPSSVDLLPPLFHLHPRQLPSSLFLPQQTHHPTRLGTPRGTR